jgi:hypothetical protein
MPRLVFMPSSPTFVPAMPTALRGLLLLLLAAALQWTALAASAQQPRPVPLPADATYGELKAFQHPQARIGDKLLRLAPGAKLHNTQNLIIMPVGMPQQASVLYRLDPSGEIIELWLLTPAEAAAAKTRK